MAKFMIIDNDGNITRTINLPYEGILIDISAMPDAEWEEIYSKLHEYKVGMQATGDWKKDTRGLPKIVKDLSHQFVNDNK